MQRLVKFSSPLLVCIVAILIAAVPLRAASRDLLACSTDKAVFVAQVHAVQNPTDHTTSIQSTLYRRLLEGDGKFSKVISLGDRITALAGQSDDAVVLLEDGQWMTIRPGESPLGTAIPDAKMVTIAGGGSIWAIALPQPAATQPASTLPSTNASSTAPATTTVPSAGITNQSAGKPSLKLFHLSGAQWESVADLPPVAASASAEDLTLSISGETPTIALASFGGVQTWTWADSKWITVMTARAGHLPNDFRLLECGTPPILWSSDSSGQWLSRGGSDQSLPSDGAPPDASRSAACVAEGLRVFSVDPAKPGIATDEKVFEQVYTLKGVAVGKRVELAVAPRTLTNDLEGWISTLLTVVVAVLLIGSTWRRPMTAAGEASLAAIGYPLAMPGYRLLAGVIDLLPVWIAIAVESIFVNLPTNIGDVPTVQQMLPFYIGIGVYLLAVTAGELIAGRSLGKWICGLRVVQINGEPLAQSAILLRNLLRVVDIFLLWIPLAMILVSPLRQRLGDVVAGTVVVRDVAPIGPEPLTAEPLTPEASGGDAAGE